ncbi:MAG: isochorismate synthase [Anaerolineae bacterium]|nr:isochorismate synthase [Anaerolineae bacterium]
MIRQPETTTQTRIRAWSMPLPKTSLTAFLEIYAGEPRFYFEKNQDELSFAAAGIAAQISGQGHGRFDAVRRQADDLFEHISPLAGSAPDAPAPMLFGGFSFFPDFTPQADWESFPPASFTLPKVVLARRQGNCWLSFYQTQQPDQSDEDIRAGLQEEGRILRENLQTAAQSGEVSRHTANDISYPRSKDSWERSVSSAVEHIRQSALEKIVLSRTCQVSSGRPLDPVRSLARLAESYPTSFRFLVELAPQHAFFGASPERLAAVGRRRLELSALAGSAPRDTHSQTDQALGAALLEDPKNLHEHAFVVNYIRAQLTPLLDSIEVDAQPSLRLLPNIQHLNTEISGQLASECTILDVVEAMHPTPAVGGFPKEEAASLIPQLENYQRGWYASPLGWFDSQGDGEFIVAIRSALLNKNKATLFSGAGIVENSDPSMEWEETQIKFLPMLDAIG